MDRVSVSQEAISSVVEEFKKNRERDGKLDGHGRYSARYVRREGYALVSSTHWLELRDNSIEPLARNCCYIAAGILNSNHEIVKEAEKIKNLYDVIQYCDDSDICVMFVDRTKKVLVMERTIFDGEMLGYVAEICTILAIAAMGNVQPLKLLPTIMNEIIYMAESEDDREQNVATLAYELLNTLCYWL